MDELLDVLREWKAGETMVETKRLRMLAGVCLGFVVLADYLFYDQPAGWTVGGYGLLLMGAILLADGPPWRSLPRALITAALTALLLGCFLEPSCLCMVLGALGLISLAIVHRQGWSTSAVVWAKRWAVFVLDGLSRVPKDVVIHLNPKRARDSAWRSLRNWGILVYLALVFLSLLALANPIISSWLSWVREWLAHLWEMLPTVARVGLWVAVGMGVWALLRSRSGVADSREEVVPASVPLLDAVLSPGVIVRCLLVFNALFAVQTVLDLRYLWGGARLPKGMTYAGYAHQGAYWLLAAVLLAAVFVVATFRAGSQADKMRSARGLVYAWLGQNVFLAISAGFRLCLYVEVYSLTQWRVAAIIWMLLIVLGLIWTLVRILAGRLNLWLVNVNAITALAVLYVCAFLNFDGFIADFNVRHCREAGGNGVPIDIGYLKELGPEVLPALFRLDGELRGARKAKVLNTTIQDLERQLHADSKNWRGWTLRRRWLAARVFERRRMRDGGPETH